MPLSWHAERRTCVLSNNLSGSGRLRFNAGQTSKMFAQHWTAVSYIWVTILDVTYGDGVWLGAVTSVSVLESSLRSCRRELWGLSVAGCQTTPTIAGVLRLLTPSRDKRLPHKMPRTSNPPERTTNHPGWPGAIISGVIRSIRRGRMRLNSWRSATFDTIKW